MTWRSAEQAQQDNGRTAPPRRGIGMLIAAAVAAIVLAGCGSPGQGTGAKPGGGQAASWACAARRTGQARPGPAVPGTTWPERRAGTAADRPPNYSALALDPATGIAYTLIRHPAAPGPGPYRLSCTNLATGLTRKGPDLLAPGLAFASGYLWASGQPGREPVVVQIDPRSLHVIRSIKLPGVAAPAYAALHVTTGPGHSVWAGSTRTGSARTGQVAAYRLDTGSGRILATARLPAGTAAYDLAADPSGTVLYAAASHIVGAGPEGNVVLEYDARSGRLLATADHGLVTDSIAGSWLAAVPRGVWVSFRTGMLGLTLHLRQASLALTAPTGPGVADSPATSLFHWAMYASAVYGGGSLWLANQAGFLACLDPVTGRPRATERLSQDRLVYQLFAADPVRHRLYGADGKGLLVITPPAACWAAP